MKKYMFFITILLIILVLTSKVKKEYTKEIEEKENEKIIVNLYMNEEIVPLNLEEYVLGVVACEMPASFHTEALKSMAVASRTYALNKMKDNVVETSLIDQCYNTNEQMKDKWGSLYEKYYNIIKSAVNETEGVYMSYNNAPIKALYFSTSNGLTENVESVFSESLDYLKSVDSSWDKDASTFYRETGMSTNDFMNALGITSIDSINIISRNNTNRVEKIEVNDNVYSGVEFRKLLNLRSTDFEITYEGDFVLITTKGYGHGVGMSQYGANGMALKGYTYDEILKYYYKNIEILNV